MKTLLKWIFGIVLSIVVLVGIGIGLLLFVVDPNDFKPEIEQLAQENDLELQIRGDLSWQFFPNIAITVGETELSGKDLPKVQFQQADLALDLGKLFGGNIAVNKIAISDPLIRLELSDNNTSEQTADADTAPVKAAQKEETVLYVGTADGEEMTLAVHSLTVQNGTVELLQNGQLQQRIENLNISSQNLNLHQQPFPVSIEMHTSVTDVAEQVALGFTGDVTTNNVFQKLSIDNGRLDATITSNAYGHHKLTANLATQVDLDKDTLQLPETTIELDGTPIKLAADITSLTKRPRIQATLDVPTFTLPPMLRAFKIDSATIPVSQFGFKTSLNSQGNQHQLSGLELVMDDFTLSGEVGAMLADINEIKALLKGTTLNLDDYLPAGEEQPAEQQAEALFAPLLAPLAALNGGRGQVDISLEQLTVQGVTLDNLHLNVAGNGSVIQVIDASAGGFGGTLKSDARIDLSSNPKLTFNVTANAVDMGAALTTLADFKELSGTGNLTFSGATAGNTSDELIAGMKGSGNFQLADPAYSALNIERQFCAVAGDKEQQPDSWPTGSRFDNASSNFTLNGQTLRLDQLSTGVGNLKLKGGGSMALLDGVMDMNVIFNINGAKSSEEGCVLRSKSIQNRDLPIRLRGNVDDMKGLITNALVELMTKRVIERKADRLLDKLLGTDEGEGEGEENPDGDQPKDSKDQVKDLLKDLLKKR